MNAQLHHGDCRDVLPRLAAEGLRAQTCVTSPPYWGLRDYGLPATPWEPVTFTPVAGLPPITVPAWDGALGLEPDPWMFVGHLVAVFRLVRDVLAEDGVLWLNLGDSYAADRGYQVPSTKGGPKHSTSQAAGGKGSSVPSGLKPKNLVGIPWRVAYALQADGWYLRSDVIWAKPNPMPESVTDRPTKAHEYLFLLAASEQYYYDIDAISEDAASKDNRKPFAPGQVDRRGNGHDRGGGGERTNGLRGADRRNKRSVWTVATQPYPEAHFATFPEALVEPCILAGSRPGDTVLDPFGGSGTTGAVAQRLGRSAVLIEAAEHYMPLIQERTAQGGLVLGGAA